MSTIQKIQKVIDQVPRLTNFGIGLWNNSTDPVQMKGSQETLLSNEVEFEQACQWLSNIKKRKTINRMSSSYGLKHVAERVMGCGFSNGTFIAAAIHCGFDYKIRPNSPNVAFNMCNKCLEQMTKIANCRY